MASQGIFITDLREKYYLLVNFQIIWPISATNGIVPLWQSVGLYILSLSMQAVFTTVFKTLLFQLISDSKLPEMDEVSLHSLCQGA